MLSGLPCLHLQAITTTSMAVSHIMLEAYKKYILLALILYGKASYITVLCFACLSLQMVNNADYGTVNIQAGQMHNIFELLGFYGQLQQNHGCVESLV